jgi:hypothetical protein
MNCLRWFSLVGALSFVGSAGAQESLPEANLSLALGTNLFDSVCLASIGNPAEFHRLIARTELKPLPSEQSPDGETWAGGVGGVSVVVQYTKSMTCFVYMSHAKEAEVRLHIIKAIKVLTRQGAEVRSPSSAIPADSSVLRFNVLSPQGNYMLMALFRAGPPSLVRSALVAGPFQ